MRKLLLGLVLLGSIAFAEPMPEGSKQFRVLASFIEATSAFAFACLPELDRPGVQVMCIQNLIDAHEIMPWLDQVLIQESSLSPQQHFWEHDLGSNRYQRSYTFTDGGTLEAIFAPEDSNRLYIFYNP